MQRADVTFLSDGVRYLATLYLPEDAGEKLPCVVMGHGAALTRGDGLPRYAERFVEAGFAAFAFDYRHWGGSAGEPRGWFSIRDQLADWRAAVAHARTMDRVDSDRLAVWGMSVGGGHALMTAAADPGIKAVVALVPLADGRAFMLQPAPPGVTARALWRAVKETITRLPVTMPVAGAPGNLAVIAAPEALTGFLRATADRQPGDEWRNEINTSAAFAMFRYRPVQRASDIDAPVLLQLGEDDRAVPPQPIEKTAARAPHAELIRYPMDHFGCFSAEHLDGVAADQIAFLRRHFQ